MQSVSSRIWTRIAVSISCEDNHYTTGTARIEFLFITITYNPDTTSTSYGDWDETINHISECRKLAQKAYKTRHDWVGKVMYWELCKKLEFDHTNKCYIHKPEPHLKNET